MTMTDFDELDELSFVTQTLPKEHAEYQYHATVHDMSPDDRPRERLQKYGPEALPTSDLLAIILRSGSQQENVMELSQKLIRKYGGLSGLTSANFHALCNEHGVGPAKACQLKAALEIGRRLMLEDPHKKFQIRSADDAASLFRMEMMHLDHEETDVARSRSIRGSGDCRTGRDAGYPIPVNLYHG